jgi:glycosyltransferase involved in cell wall biosynthesis
MKILIVNTYDTLGGAARAAYRLHKALQSIGITSQMLVQTKVSDDPTILGPEKKLEKFINLKRPELDAFPLRFYKYKKESLFSPSWLPFTNIINKINASDADIVHLHWIANGMINIKDISRIKKPIVWSLHDMWAFSGGCHYDTCCGKYATHCNMCPLLGATNKNDLSYHVFEKKMKYLTKIQSLTIVGLSRWISECAGKSPLLAGREIVNLPNPLDSQVFRPIKKDLARDLLNLPFNKNLVLFGADNAILDSRKGFSKLTAALHSLKSTDIELVVFGSGPLLNSLNFDYPVHHFGYMPGDLSLRILYNAADVMVMPSIQENLANTIMESLACGTPVVAFDIGGNRDMIDHQKNGYLAEPFSPTSLAKGIDWVLNYTLPQELSHNARQKVIERFDSRKVAEQYLGLYQKIVEKVLLD